MKQSRSLNYWVRRSTDLFKSWFVLWNFTHNIKKEKRSYSSKKDGLPGIARKNAESQMLNCELKFRQKKIVRKTILILLNFKMAGETGLEPAASSVTGWRYNQLNYSPTLLEIC
jgi:hypothetical protein